MLVDDGLEVGAHKDGVGSLQVNTSLLCLTDLCSMAQLVAIPPPRLWG